MSEVEVSFPTDALSVVDRTSIDAQPWEPLRGLAGVDQKVLWRSGQMIVGIVRLAPGAREPGHAHHDADHHVYVLDGSARIGGHLMEAGAFAFVPAGVTHAITDVGPEGCTLFYTYAPQH
jgi:quercetin dioxygenase-like cupin family protein